MCLFDQNTGKTYIGRDPIGVRSLYIGYTEDGSTMIASEMKSLVDHCKKIN